MDRLSHILPRKDRGRLVCWSGIVDCVRYRTIPARSGCYAMDQDGEIVYIGQAINLRRRVMTHLCRPGGFPCTAVRWMECGAGEMDWLERSLIDHYHPAFNKQTGVWARGSRRLVV